MPLCFWILFSLVIAPSLALAQRTPLLIPEDVERSRTMLERAPSDRIALEGAIDPAAYIVGPGDVFTVSVGGAEPSQRPLEVSAEGALVVPEVGSFAVAGLTLHETRALVEPALRQAYQHVGAEVALARPRQFLVHVSGAVDRPGRHTLGAVARVEDAVREAMEGPPSVSARAAIRNVEVRRRDGSFYTVDLRRYYATGRAALNPPLLDGDEVYVPDRHAHRLVSVEFERAHTVTLDARDDDTLTGVLAAAGGDVLLRQFTRARILRAGDGGSGDGGSGDGRAGISPGSGPHAGGTHARGGLALGAEEHDLRAILAGEAPDPTVRPLDRVLLPSPMARRGTVRVDGFVVSPGAYPIVEYETTLEELLAAAGGVAPEGLLRAAYLERDGVRWEPGGGEATGAVGAPAVSGEGADPVEAAAFAGARLSDLAFGTRQYMAREMMGPRRVSLAVPEGGEMPLLTLQDGDRLVVPRDPQAVLVAGHVRRPGYVAYREGAPAAHYVEEAGGLGPAPAETYVREVGTGYFRAAGAAPPRSGDVVFVDRRGAADTEAQYLIALQERQFEFERREARSQRRFQTFQAGLTVVSTTVALVTTYLLARRN